MISPHIAPSDTIQVRHRSPLMSTHAVFMYPIRLASPRRRRNSLSTRCEEADHEVDGSSCEADARILWPHRSHGRTPPGTDVLASYIRQAPEPPIRQTVPCQRSSRGSPSCERRRLLDRTDHESPV